MSLSWTMKRILIIILTLPLLTAALANGATQPAIQIIPDQAFIGEPARILLQGFPKNTPVNVDVRQTNTYGHFSESHAQFLTDRHGCVDVTKQAPLSGTYQHRDPFGLFWSMSVFRSDAVAKPRRGAPLQPVAFQFTASINGHTLATTEFRRLLLAPGVRRIPVHDGKLRGALFVPAGKFPHPAVIVLGGSEGGLSTELAASYLASKGFAALALAYFRYDDLPKNLENIPLEYFGEAIHWLQSQPEIRPDKIAVLGGSRGGELALLLGSTFPQIKAVVAISASGVVWGGLPDPRLPAWTYHGKPVPFMNMKWTPAQIRRYRKALQEHLNGDLLWCQIQLSDTNAVEKASIPVEKINGPILLISGNDDQLWPSTEMSDMVMARLKRMKHPFPDCHLAYPGVGHYIPLPTLPATVRSFGKEQLGGNTEATAAAALDSWTRTIEFLDENLKE
ncbi:MAG: acyl-CoA thioester hydrolase/BAAT C-terminal domain-containing protein [Limisphaerales bacterium]